MNSELLNRLPELKKLSVAGWSKEDRANGAARKTMEKTSGLRASTPLVKLKKKRIEKKKEKGKFARGRLETPGGWLEKSISISCSRLLPRNLETERFGLLPSFSGIPVASSATKISILGFLGSCSLWAKDGVRCKDVPVVFPKRRLSFSHPPDMPTQGGYISPYNQKLAASSQSPPKVGTEPEG